MSYSSVRRRVLFLRSHCKAYGAVAIAGGLCANPQYDFAQYPAWPTEYRSTLKKWDNDEEASWNALHTNLIQDSKTLKRKLSHGEFELAILSDHNGWLFEYPQASLRQKVRIWLNTFQHGRKHSISRIRSQATYRTALPFSLAELCQQIPVVAVDLLDHPYLTPENIHILQECKIYFKREVPYDLLALFAVRNFTYYFKRQWLRENQKDDLLSLTNKVSQIPLGIPDEKFQRLTALRMKEQDIDVFWAGSLSNTMRSTVVKLLKELSLQRRWNIVIADKFLPYQEYYRMVARSKLIISIAGGGWDCMRHYESVTLGSLPLINKPTVDAVWWHDMPEEIYFENNFSNFVSRIEQLLKMDTLRQNCLYLMETKIRERMQWSKIVEYLIEEAMKT